MGNSGALFALLGRRPDGMSSDESDAVVERILGRTLVVRDWPESFENMKFLHRSFGDLLRELGGTEEAGLSIRHKLQLGDLRAVILQQENGSEVPLEPNRWRGEASRALYWFGKTTDPQGAVYILDSAPAGAMPKPDVLPERERNTVRRLVLGLVMIAYDYRPNSRSGVPGELARDLEKRGLGVSDDTIRKWLNEAVEEVYDPANDQSGKT